MPGTMTPNTTPGDAATLVWRWAHEVCLAPSASAAELARAMQVDIDKARSLGRQRIFPPSPATSTLQFVLGPDDETVIFIEVATNVPMTVPELTDMLGPGREAPPGPHQVTPTIIFDDLWPHDAARGCSVLARVTTDYPQSDAVETVVLYLQASRL